MVKRSHVSACSASKSSNRGFTLLEIIIVIGITLLVLTAVYLSLYYSGRSTAQTRATIVREQELMKVFYQIRHQVTNLYSQEDQETLLGEEGVEDNHSEIYFLTTSMERYQGVGEVGYKIITEDDGKPYLAYTEFPYPRSGNRFAVMNPQDKWRPVSRMIHAFHVEYRYQNQWHKEWKGKNELPEWIRFTLYYKVNEEDEEEALKEYSFIVVPGIKAIF